MSDDTDKDDDRDAPFPIRTPSRGRGIGDPYQAVVDEMTADQTDDDQDRQPVVDITDPDLDASVYDLVDSGAILMAPSHPRTRRVTPQICDAIDQGILSDSARQRMTLMAALDVQDGHRPIEFPDDEMNRDVRRLLAALHADLRTSHTVTLGDRR